MLLRRLYLLIAALVLVLASAEARAYARALLPESALRACASVGSSASGQNGDVSASRAKEKCVAAQKWTVGVFVDNDDRLLSADVKQQPPSLTTPDEKTVWTFDGVGNRLTEIVTRTQTSTITSSKTYSYSARDQLEQMTDSVNQLTVAYGYSGNGNRTSRTVTKQSPPSTQTTTYVFDARDRMIKAQPNAPNDANAPTVDYVYDADGRQVERIETPAGGGTPTATLFIYNGQTLLHEADPSNGAGGLRISDTYRHSALLDRHIAYAQGGGTDIRFYQLDGLQTPVAMTDGNGDTVNRTAYSAWGEIEEQTANGVVQAPWQLPNYSPDETGQAALLSNDGQSIGFTGYRKDEDTGLYYAQARWYDPLVGNFNGMDPAMGNSAQPITLNKYVYANTNPLIYVDPSGRAGFLTVMRNGFDRVDEGLRETAVTFPILADQIGVTRGAVALASTPIRMYNLASDVVAQALPGEALRGLSDQGSAELARTVDPMAGLAIDYANDPEGTRIRVAVKVGLATKDKIVAAAGGDGGARSDIVSFGTQMALPIAGEAALANMGSKVFQSAGYLDDVSRINAQAAARQLERSADNVAAASGKGEQAALGGVAVENTAALEQAVALKVKPDYGSGRGRRGTRETREHIDEERDAFLDASPEYEHVGGGTDRLTGQQIREEYIEGPNGGSQGSSYPDLTFRAPDGSRIRINTVDADDMGNMTPRERANFDRIFEQTGEPIIAVPKPAPKPKPKKPAVG